MKRFLRYSIIVLEIIYLFYNKNMPKLGHGLRSLPPKRCRGTEGTERLSFAVIGPEYTIMYDHLVKLESWLTYLQVVNCMLQTCKYFALGGCSFITISFRADMHLNGSHCSFDKGRLWIFFSSSRTPIILVRVTLVLNMCVVEIEIISFSGEQTNANNRRVSNPWLLY